MSRMDGQSGFSPAAKKRMQVWLRDNPRSRFGSQTCNGGEPGPDQDGLVTLKAPETPIIRIADRLAEALKQAGASVTITDFQAGREIAADDLETALRRMAGRTTESAGALPQGDDGLVAFTGGGCVSGIQADEFGYEAHVLKFQVSEESGGGLVLNSATWIPGLRYIFHLIKSRKRRNSAIF